MTTLSTPAPIRAPSGFELETADWPDEAGIGKWANGLASASLFFGLLLSYGVAPVKELLSVPVLLLAIGALGMSPRWAINRLPVSISYGAVVSWALLSIAWTGSPTTANFLAKRDVSLWFALPLAASLLTRTQLEKVVLWSVRATILITTAFLVVKPDTRVGLPITGEAPLPGWHGGFLHKNVMGPVLVVGLAAVLLFDKRRSSRWLTAAAIMILILGSDSTTALVGAGVAMLIIPWIHFAKQLSGRSIVAFALGSILIFAASVGAVVASLAAVVQVAGKDLTFTGRTKIWSATIHAIEARPWHGYGLGGVFSVPKTPVTDRVVREIGFSVPHAHNGTIDMVSQIGIIGAVLFFIMFIATASTSIRSLRTAQSWGTWAITMMISMFLISFSESVFLGPWLGIYGAILMTGLNIRNANRRNPIEKQLPFDD